MLDICLPFIYLSLPVFCTHPFICLFNIHLHPATLRLFTASIWILILSIYLHPNFIYQPMFLSVHSSIHHLSIHIQLSVFLPSKLVICIHLSSLLSSFCIHPSIWPFIHSSASCIQPSAFLLVCFLPSVCPSASGICPCIVLWIHSSTCTFTGRGLSGLRFCVSLVLPELLH